MVIGERAWLTRHMVVAQALALADREGLEAVTIRRLADQLGVTPMGMYWHVKDRGELLAAMSDQLLAEIVPARGSGQPWHLRLRVMTVALLDVLRAHPCAPALLSAADADAAGSGAAGSGAAGGFTRVTEAVLEPLRQAGFTPQEALLIAAQLLHGVMGLVARQPGRGPGMTDPDAYFAFGADLLLAGVEAVAQRRLAGDPQRRTAGDPQRRTAGDPQRRTAVDG